MRSAHNAKYSGSKNWAYGPTDRPGICAATSVKRCDWPVVYGLKDISTSTVLPAAADRTEHHCETAHLLRESRTGVSTKRSKRSVQP